MSIAVGLAACVASSFSFGSMYVAVRKAGDAGDGMVVQWIVCSSIFFCGLLTYIATGAPPFQPFAMLGGLLWAVGNLTAIPIIRTIGLGMGILVWGAVNCVVGWATGRFGLFGVKGSTPSSPNINFVGLVLVIVGGTLFAFVRPKTAELLPPAQSLPLPVDEERERTEAAEEPLMEEQQTTQQEEGVEERVTIETGAANVSGRNQPAQNQLKKRIIAIVLSVLAGICYGSTFTPVIYIQDNPEKFNNPPKDAIYYVFSHFAGIYLTSTAVLLIYVAYKRNNPFFDNQLILPSFLAGILWAVAMLAWFVANDILSQAITFPINAMAPGVIASLWSVFYFKEIEKKDLPLLLCAMFVTIFGVALVGLSKAL